MRLENDHLVVRLICWLPAGWRISAAAATTGSMPDVDDGLLAPRPECLVVSDSDSIAPEEREDVPASPADVFDLLRDDVRCSIVRTLFERSNEQWHFGSVAYSELRRAVGVEDGGKFNYHLGQLRGTLVTQEDDGSYRLTLPGHYLARTLVRGEVTGADHQSTELSACFICDRPLTVHAADGFVGAECPEHGHLFSMLVPPSATESHDVGDLLALAIRRGDWHIELAMEGCCHECWGPLTVTAPVPAHETPVVPDYIDVSTPETYVVEFDCARCNHTFWYAPGTCVVRHPAVIAFCWDHGQNALAGELSLLEFANPFYPLVERTDAGVAVTIVRGDEQLRVELDDAANVVDVTRSPAEVERPSMEQFIDQYHE